MELTVPNETKSSKDDYEQLPAGSHEAICIDAIYPVVKQFENNPPRNCVLFVFELNDKRKRKDKEPDDSRYQVWSNSMTISLHSMSTLRPFLESWVGKDLDPNDKLSLEDMVGKGAVLTTNLKKKSKKPDEKYVNIVAILPGKGGWETDSNYERKDAAEYSDNNAGGNTPF